MLRGRRAAQPDSAKAPDVRAAPAVLEFTPSKAQGSLHQKPKPRSAELAQVSKERVSKLGYISESGRGWYAATDSLSLNNREIKLHIWIWFVFVPFLAFPSLQPRVLPSRLSQGYKELMLPCIFQLVFSTFHQNEI